MGSLGVELWKGRHSAGHFRSLHQWAFSWKNYWAEFWIVNLATVTSAKAVMVDVFYTQYGLIVDLYPFVHIYEMYLGLLFSIVCVLYCFNFISSEYWGCFDTCVTYKLSVICSKFGKVQVHFARLTHPNIIQGKIGCKHFVGQVATKSVCVPCSRGADVLFVPCTLP